MKNKYTLATLTALGLATSANAAIVAQFSFETDISNSVVGGATASNVTGTTAAGTAAKSTNTATPAFQLNTGNVLDISTGNAGIRLGIALGQGTNTSLTSIGDNFSIAAWYRIDSDFVNGGDDRHFVWEADNSFYTSYNANPTTGNSQSYTQNPNANVLYAGGGTAGVWQHVVQTYEISGNNLLIKTYLNGVYQTGGDLTAANTNPGDFNVLDLNIGMHRAEGRFLDGQIDELTIWDNTLTAGDVTNVYGSQVIPEPSSTALLGLAGLALILRRCK